MFRRSERKEINTGPDLWVVKRKVTLKLPMYQACTSKRLQRDRLEPRSLVPEIDRLEPTVLELSVWPEPLPRPPLLGLPRVLDALAGASGIRNCPSLELEGRTKVPSRSEPLGNPSKGGVALRGTLGPVVTLERRLPSPVWLRMRVMRRRMFNA